MVPKLFARWGPELSLEPAGYSIIFQRVFKIALRAAQHAPTFAGGRPHHDHRLPAGGAVLLLKKLSHAQLLSLVR